MMAFMGVRISWLMLARKVLLALAGLGRRVARFFQFGRHALALGDVARRGQHAGHGAVGVAVDAGVGQHRRSRRHRRGCRASGQSVTALQEGLAHAFARVRAR
jgi:hypothetical protein